MKPDEWGCIMITIRGISLDEWLDEEIAIANELGIEAKEGKTKDYSLEYARGVIRALTNVKKFIDGEDI